MTLRSSLSREQQLVDVDKNDTSLERGATGLGVLAVKKTLWEMGYHLTQTSGGSGGTFFATFDQDLVDALKKFATTQQGTAGADGKIDRAFLQALDRIMLGGDFNVPNYGPVAATVSTAGPEAAAAAATALLPDIQTKLGNAATILQLAYLALEKKFVELPAPPGGAKPSSNAEIYQTLAPAFDHNFSFNKMSSDTERRNGLFKIANTLQKAITFIRAGNTNFKYAPPALVHRHGVGDNAYAYWRPTDRKVYFTNLLPKLRDGGRWRATTHELMHAAGIDHGTFAHSPPYWWNLDAYHKLSPSQRLNNADNYVWFVVYCLNPFGRKQPQP
jgi:hypothetical protein